MKNVGFIYLLFGSSTVNAFVIPVLQSATKVNNGLVSGERGQSSSRHEMITDPSDPLFLPLDEQAQAQREFFIWFFGSSGAAAIGRRSFPIIYENNKLIRKLARENPLPEGEKLGVSPLCLYPRDLTIEEIMQVVDNPTSVETIVEKNPVEGNFLAAKGYLTYDAFKAGNQKANPFAIRAVMDTFATSTNVVNPFVAQDLLDSYRADRTGKTFKNALLISKLKGFSAVVVLLFCLGLADVIAFIAAARGWFPDWPGRIILPEGLWSPGIWTIPQYWTDYDLSSTNI